ncbi:EAL domain-containing protein [Aliikangiella sp. IMCC44359]|uniref:EAL domain-containing protein n=1 Tax=Aliikangiella sp. IMCC44359 TaxID=3459125 RepID=UPI00403AD9CF
MQNSGLKAIRPTRKGVFEETIKSMLQATAGRLGEDFLHGLVQTLCNHLAFDSVFIGCWHQKSNKQIRTIATTENTNTFNNNIFHLNDSICEAILHQGSYYLIDNAKNSFPNDKLISKWNAQGCLGTVLLDSNQQVIGFLVALTRNEMRNAASLINILEIFSFRIAAELERQAINQNLYSEVKVNQAQLDSVPALMFTLNRKGKLIRWNQYFCSRFGYDYESLLHENILMAVHEADRKRIVLEIEKIFTDGGGSIYLNGVTHSGDIVPLLATLEVTAYNGEPVIVGVALDMTEQQVVERNLLRSQGRLASKNSQLSLINNLTEKLHSSHNAKQMAKQVVNLLSAMQKNACFVFVVVDSANENMEIVAHNGISEELIEKRKRLPFGAEGSLSGLVLKNHHLEVFSSFENDDRIDTCLRKGLIDDGIHSGIVLPFIYQQDTLGSLFIGHKSDSKVSTDEVEFYQTIRSSISLALANARQFKLMEDLATCDTLTGLPNRNALNKDCQNALKSTSAKDSLIGLILIDLDRFKEINDTLDHQIGDKLLKLIGPRLTQRICDNDCNVYRLGGDEFCVLVTNKTEAACITQIAELIFEVIAEPFLVDNFNLEISSSIGVSITECIQPSPAEMLRCAELAMYQIKNEGGGIVQYSPEMDADTNQRFVIMAEMAEAIRNNELVLHYQPKFDLKTRKICGCEALVRWQHKTYGLLPPEKFIPFVELTQLIHPLTCWVMKTAMKQIQQWKKQGIYTSVAINLSTRNLVDDEFIGQVDSLMKEYNIESHEIEFEVTETVLMSNLDRALKQLSEFNTRNIRCSLDDYGTGYSSLSYLKKLPIDMLKIDRSFISKMLLDSEDRIIAQSTINLAHNLDMKVVAEGVEDEKTLLKLAEQGCDLVQGYFISKPLGAEEFLNMYQTYI